MVSVRTKIRYVGDGGGEEEEEVLIKAMCTRGAEKNKGGGGGVELVRVHIMPSGVLAFATRAWRIESLVSYHK